jgi:hypothetical protein
MHKWSKPLAIVFFSLIMLGMVAFVVLKLSEMKGRGMQHAFAVSGIYTGANL